MCCLAVVVCCVLSFVVDRCLVFVVCCLLCFVVVVGCRSLFAVCLFEDCCVFVVCWLVCVVCCLLFVDCLFWACLFVRCALLAVVCCLTRRVAVCC